MRESEIKAKDTMEMKEMNNQELNLNEMEQVSGGMSLFEFWIRNSRGNEDD